MLGSITSVLQRVERADASTFAALAPRPLNKATQSLQHSEEFVEEENTAVVAETPVIKGDLNVSWRSAHPEPHFTKSDVRLRSIKLIGRAVNKGQNQLHLCILTPDSGHRALMGSVRQERQSCNPKALVKTGRNTPPLAPNALLARFCWRLGVLVSNGYAGPQGPAEHGNGRQQVGLLARETYLLLFEWGGRWSTDTAVRE